jgi:hypothetical protein
MKGIHETCRARNQFISGVNCFRYLLNKTVDIQFSAHDTFREYPSSGTLNIEILESQIM